MKKQIFTLFTLLIACSAFAQGKPEVLQDICVGDVASGYDRPQTWIRELVPMDAKATLVAGYASLNGSFYSHPYHHNADTFYGFDGFAHKVDSLGNIEWTRFVGGSGNDFIHAVTKKSCG